MEKYCALLRAVNVGGTGKLPMAELRAMCERAGFKQVKTYIASGNVVFCADGSETDVRAALEAELGSFAGKPAPVFIRTATQLEGIAAENPFADKAGNQVTVTFLDEAPSQTDLGAVRHQASEEIIAKGQEIYIFFPKGQGASKMSLPVAKHGTARNMNTVNKLVLMLQSLSI